MKLKLSHATLVILAVFGGLFYLKYTVELKEERLADMKAQYLADQKALRVLKAEWAYLNSPEYLQAMAEKYLMLKPVGHKQVVSWFREVPERPYQTPVVALAVQDKIGSGGTALEVSGLSPGRDDEP